MDRKREQELIRAAQRGDKKALAALYRANVDKIYRYIVYRVESPSVAEDLTGDVFLRMLEGLATYQDRSTPLLVWLYRIAHARVIDHYRRSKHSAQQEDIDTIELGTDPQLDVPLEFAYTSANLQQALLTLTDAQRQVVVLRFVEGYNLEQTAKIMNKTVDAIKAMQYRALQAMGQVLRQQGFKGEG